MAKTINRRLAELIDSSGQLTAGKLPDGFITTAHYSANSITDAKLHTSFSLPASALTARDTGDLSEGSNLYYTDARADARIAAADTGDLSEGSNLYYTDARVGTYISGNRTFGNITTTGYIAGPASMVIDPAGVGDNTGTVVIAGNLQVDGTTTTINSTTVSIDDLNFTIASDAADSSAANGAGITIGGASATMLYTHATTSFDFNKPVNVTGNIGVSGTVDGVDIAARDAVLTSATTTAGAALPKAGGTMTGSLVLGNASGTYSYELKFTNGNYQAGIDYQNDGNLRFIDRSSSRVGATINMINGNFSAFNTSNAITNLLNTNGDSYLNGGNVGIGTSSPAVDLDVRSNSVSNPAFISTGNSDGSEFVTLYGGTSVDQKSAIWWDSGQSELKFGTAISKIGASESIKMTIKSTGKVGIGTTSPSTPLHVTHVGNPNGGNRNTVEDVLTLETTGYFPYAGYGMGINFQGEDYGNSAIRDYGKIQAVMSTSSDQNAAGDPVFSSHLGFWTNTGGASATVSTEKMILSNAGNLGIGTNSPSRGLTIDRSNEFASLEIIKNNTTNQIVYLGTGSSGGTDDAILQLKHGGTENIRLYTSGNSWIKGGDVGIGTAAPVASTNKTVLGVQGVWGGQVDIMVGTAVHASFGTDNFASGQSARIQSQDGIVFKSGGSTERMRIDGTGNTQIGAPILSHIGGNKFFINKAVNAAPATSGTTQTGGALRLRGGDNAVLDMGMNSVNTWIQATDRANLANGYSLALNPNGGNVGIGINAPAVPLHVRKVAGLNTTVELLRLDCGDTTHVGGKAGTIKFTDISVYNPTAEITAARVGVTSSSFLKFDLRSSEIMRMQSGGDMIYGGGTGVHEKYFSGFTTGNGTLSHDIIHTADNSTGTVLEIKAAFTHHPSYDCILHTWISRRDATVSHSELFRRNTTLSGSWTVSRVSATVTRVTKNAGTYAGGGPYWIKAVWKNYD